MAEVTSSTSNPLLPEDDAVAAGQRLHRDHVLPDVPADQIHQVGQDVHDRCGVDTAAQDGQTLGPGRIHPRPSAHHLAYRSPVHVVPPDEVLLQEAGRIGDPEVDAGGGGLRHHLRATRDLQRQRLLDHDRPPRGAGGHHRIDVGVLGKRHDHRVDAGVVDQCGEIVAIGIRLGGLGQTLRRL